jgi:hypothetical protein
VRKGAFFGYMAIFEVFSLSGLFGGRKKDFFSKSQGDH